MTTEARLVSDFKTLISDAEELARATAAQTGDRIVDLRTRVQQSAAAIKPRLERAEAAVRDTADKTDAYVRSNPWTTAGMAAGIGFIVGALLRRH
jgi:ElaB/YqjD/DUF883 family membrane-anchored ribosome-binding protein